VKAVEVAAAVILRPDGSFLLARRPVGKVYAGYWEFPGGKVEPGEAVERALERELHEELGIEVERAYPWITRVFTYPHATVRLRFFRVLSFKGEPHPREKQEIAWQGPGARMAEPMLPANSPVLAALGLPDEYAITDAGRMGTDAMLAALQRRLQGGLALLQVREPLLNEPERVSFTRTVIELAHRHGCRVLAKEPFPGADGIHFTASQSLTIDRRPARGLGAASCHTREELGRAMRLGMDFAVLGPVKPTSSHPARRPLGWEEFTSIARDSSIPVFAIGGLGRGDLEDAWRAGAHGIAMLSGAWR
jgi:8-oxo-dGTP diphosphatase